jgi:plasmid stabilization system protein ParE
MAQVIWTEPATDDLDAIADFIALDKPSAAKRLVRKVFDATARLARFPNSARIPGELAGGAYREVIVPPCRIFYTLDGTTLYVVHVMRGEQELRPRNLTRHP